MVAEVKSESTSRPVEISLIAGLYFLLGIGAILFMLASMIGDGRIQSAVQDGDQFGAILLTFLDAYGIILPVIVIGFGIYFIRLAFQIYQLDVSAGSWAQQFSMWLVIAFVVAIIGTIIGSLTARGAQPQALPILFITIAGAVGFGFVWWWTRNNEHIWVGQETLTARSSRLAWNLLVPTLLVLIVVAARPLERTFIASLTDQRFAGGAAQQPEFVGLDNYFRLLGIRLDSVGCTTDDSGECVTREVQVTQTETRTIDIDGEAVRDILQRLSEGDTVSGIPNLLNPLGQPDVIDAAIADETGETAALMEWYDGERLSATLATNILSRQVEDGSVTSINSLGEGQAEVVIEATIVEEQVVYPPIREVAGDAYRQLDYSPVRTFDLFGNRIVFSARDAQFMTSFGNTLGFTVVSVVLELVLGMIIALTVNSKFPGRGLMRAAMLVPWAIPTVVSARLWEVMLRDNLSGVINSTLYHSGLGSGQLSWLGNPDTQLLSMIFVDVWKTTPFMALLLLAGLQTIPQDIYEAADVDGAGRIRQFFSITLPILRPTIAVALVFRTLDAVRAFDVFDVLVGRQLQSMATYNSFVLVETQQFGYASAVGVTIFAIILIFTVIYVRALGVDTQ